MTKIAGICLFLSLLATIASELQITGALPLAGLLAWVAGVLLFSHLASAQKKLVIILLLTGLVGLSVGPLSEQAGNWLTALTKNQSLIALLTGVTFLRLVAFPQTQTHEPLPKGKTAFFKTFWGIHFFGSVINLSAVLLVGDRLSRHHALSHEQTLIMIRAFAACANWSPFFAAFAAALIYAPDAKLSTIWSIGFFPVIISFTLTWWAMKRHHKLDSFIGYPVHFGALWLPALLAVMVVIGHYYFPQLKVIIMISSLAIIISIPVLIFRSGVKTTLTTLHQHVNKQLPKMYGELLLFLSAGVFGSGIASVIEHYHISFPLTEFNGITAAITLSLMVFASVFGIHPIISIALVGEALLPLNVDHSLLAVVFLMSWAIGVSVSPFSGLNMALQGRYGLSGKDIFNGNKIHALVMLAAGFVLLSILDYALKRSLI